MPVPDPHDLFQWNWHHFRPLGRAENYMPILEVLGEHDGELIADARSNVNLSVHALRLSVGLGKRVGQPHADIFRDRIDVWRFTGAIFEPGLVGDEIRLTELGRALLDGSAPFQTAMARQALRLSFPRVRVRKQSHLGAATQALQAALALGPGVNVPRAWMIASGHLREAGQDPSITGEEAARFLSGATSLSEIPKRADAIRRHRRGIPATDYPPVGQDKERQGREIEHWLQRNRSLAAATEATLGLDPADRTFTYKDGSAPEIERWNRWWGSWPFPPGAFASGPGAAA